MSIAKKFARSILIIFILLFLIIFIVPRIRSYVTKTKIINIVKNNQELLNDSISKGSYKEILSINGVRDVDIYTTDRGNIYIEFFCSGFGIVPSSLYYGFYYHGIDEPMGFQGSSLKFEQQGHGWYWREINGDNYNYTEKIIDNWYFYVAGF
ncbi:hypothetical protein [Clostridium sp. Cult2]|uniref:hypothetical protein n=1 Tax=Clostridium sp. Cult2 TaxID=2079003 RepID=UPI001F15BB00|nr:hypothetical protein [Clostridium sp. Cult2]MCF6465342.1 hypothetical protein [Clostridium sp. Cult2]